MNVNNLLIPEMNPNDMLETIHVAKLIAISLSKLKVCK
jgi:hypothetical protein